MVNLSLMLPISNIQRRNRQPGKSRKRVEGLLKNPTRLYRTSNSRVNVQQLFEFLKYYLENYPFPDIPVRIRVEDREFDIREVSASEHHILLDLDPEAVEALSTYCFKCGQLITQLSHVKIKLPAPYPISTNSDEDITEIYICERHEPIIEQLNDLYDEGFAGEACDLCGKSVQTNNRTLVYLDGELDPWRVICAADTQEVIAKILA